MIRVLIAEDMAMIRGALIALLACEGDIDVVAQPATDDDVVKAAYESQPDVAVIDLGDRVNDRLRLARELRRVVPDCHSMVLTSLATPRALQKALDAEVKGYILKDAPPGFLADGIRRVAKGECVVDSRLATVTLMANKDPLTDREHEVLEAASEGASVREVATRLSLAPGTVRNYLSSIIGKLGARNRVDAVRIARESGWI